MKARRHEYQNGVNADTNAASFMLVLVADTDEEKANLLAELGLDPAAEFLPLSHFMDALHARQEQKQEV
jgi:formamidopyrimidine-DNA glycosylase